MVWIIQLAHAADLAALPLGAMSEATAADIGAMPPAAMHGMDGR